MSNPISSLCLQRQLPEFLRKTTTGQTRLPRRLSVRRGRQGHLIEMKQMQQSFPGHEYSDAFALISTPLTPESPAFPPSKSFVSPVVFWPCAGLRWEH
jgi:hypothetical protein